MSDVLVWNKYKNRFVYVPGSIVIRLLLRGKINVCDKGYVRIRSEKMFDDLIVAYRENGKSY